MTNTSSRVLRSLSPVLIATWLTGAIVPSVIFLGSGAMLVAEDLRQPAVTPEIQRLRFDRLDGSAAIGPEEAPITIVAFVDYQCPLCARAHATLKELIDSYEGQLRIVFKHMPLSFHKEAELAAQAALAAMVLGEFDDMHRLLLAGQKNLSREALTEIAVAAGIDRASFDQALDSGDFAQDVKKDRELAEKIGVSSTPFFFVNGRPIRGAQPYSAFEAVIEQELGGTAGRTRWVEKLERPVRPERNPPTADGKEFDRTRAFLERIARAETPEVANTLLLSHLARMDRELQGLRKEVRELRQAMATLAGAQRARGGVAARTQAARDRIVTVGEVPLGDDPAQGSKEAKIGIVAFGDFACPYTRKFSRYVLPTIRERYVDTGRVRYVFRDRPLEQNRRSVEAAVAANCAGEQGAYWEMHDALFKLDGTLEEVDFAAMAEKLGLDAVEFRKCSADPDRQKEIQDDIEDAEIKRLGLRVVPTLLIGRIEGDRLVGAKRVSGVQSIRVLGAVVESLLRE